MLGLTFSVGDTIPLFTIVLSKTIRIGDTKHHICVATLMFLNPGPPTNLLLQVTKDRNLAAHVHTLEESMSITTGRCDLAIAIMLGKCIKISI